MYQDEEDAESSVLGVVVVKAGWARRLAWACCVALQSEPEPEPPPFSTALGKNALFWRLGFGRRTDRRTDLLIRDPTHITQTGVWVSRGDKLSLFKSRGDL